MKRHLLLPAAIWMVSLSVVHSQNRSHFIQDSLDNYISSALKDWRLPGVAVCVVKDSKVVYMKGFGVKEAGGTDSVDVNTLFMIGSNTKAFTATAIAMLDAEKKLSLNDKVTKWLPRFKLDNKLAGEQAIIADLLCHRLGFETFQGDFTYWKSNLTRNDIIEKMAHIKAVYPFRTTWGYTNAAFLTAGQIIPKVTGEQWEDFIKERILLPLDMKNTVVLSKDLPFAKDRALAHTVKDSNLIKLPYANIDNLAPAGSISSSVSDMSKWAITLLNHGKYKGKQVIDPNVIEKTWTPYSIMRQNPPMFNEGHFSLYGLGYELKEYEGRRIVEHDGGVTGFLSQFLLIPEEKIGIIVLTNSDQNYFFEALASEIEDACLNLPFRNYSQVYLKYFQYDQQAASKETKILLDSVKLHLNSTLPLKSYTGNYFNDVYGKMQIVMEKDGLQMKLSHHPTLKVFMKPLGGNRFYVTFSDTDFGAAVFTFTTANDAVKSVKVKVADFVEITPYIFRKVE
ncbi:serine hydrolase [Arachidicoccus ginsenosidivorans]|uniref:Serine hydrolase n=1 Tax=Arachidicoccus ginsenosidivorans TaxID=496057 RepID=A0A5B8VQV6_9BACT|nr:serine hydrolase [Arachidicoccus ginsenosidivorans]QEC73282.1 serine hydrolase [Arachidicoccus ginsenosidivorans]